jgi:hypothetical protein
MQARVCFFFTSEKAACIGSSMIKGLSRPVTTTARRRIKESSGERLDSSLDYL